MFTDIPDLKLTLQGLIGGAYTVSIDSSLKLSFTTDTTILRVTSVTPFYGPIEIGQIIPSFATQNLSTGSIFAPGGCANVVANGGMIRRTRIIGFIGEK